MRPEELRPGLHETLITARIERLLAALDLERVDPESGSLANAEAADRISRHVAGLIARVIELAPDDERATRAVALAGELIQHLEIDDETPLGAGLVLQSIRARRPDGSAETIERPLTPLLDTTVLTNAPGEPAIGHELRAEIASADAIDIVMAFIRWSGIRSLLEPLRRHCAAGKPLRVLTTTYTSSTEQRALDELARIGADIQVSYDTGVSRLHAKAWIFHRSSGYSTAYIGSSNLTFSAQETGMEWNVRISQARNPDAVTKMAAVFASYRESPSFERYEPERFRNAVERETPQAANFYLPPTDLVPRPFQDGLLDRLLLARHQGHHRNLLVAATGTGKTVIAAVDFARLRKTLPRDRLLFIAHREEILDQSLWTFRHAVRDASFGEKWVGGERPTHFEHVFASIQSLTSSGIDRIDPKHFDVVIIDEFHHAAAPTYARLLDRLTPVELVGLTATPERADGVDILHHFGGRIAAELRLWDAIDQQVISPFSYFGLADGIDLRDIPWKRGGGYDLNALTNVLTADHAWAHRVIKQVADKVSDPMKMRAIGFCASVAHAHFMAARFNAAGLTSVAISGASRIDERATALRQLQNGSIQALFTVDLLNEGVDVPAVDTLLLLRPTESPTLFLQQLGRGLRKSEGKGVCTVLDFVGTHRREFRYDRRFRSLLGGSRRDVEHQIERGFPFLPAGCQIELDPVAQEEVLRSIRNALPSTWRDKVQELRNLGDINLPTYLEATGLEIDDIYVTGQRTWTQLRRAAGLPTAAPGPNEDSLLRAVGRLRHVDDEERLSAYARFAELAAPPGAGLSERQGRLLRMLVASLTPLGMNRLFGEAVDDLWRHPQVLAELSELLPLLATRVSHLNSPLEPTGPNPLQIHGRYTRTEILGAFGVGDGAKPLSWQTGVLWNDQAQTDLFAFTLDKTSGGFSPTTRYRDYAMSRQLIHWESQSATSVEGMTGQRYINHEQLGTSVVLFARLTTSDAFWCLGRATYVRHEGSRPIAFTWRLEHALPADLYASFAAAVA